MNAVWTATVPRRLVDPRDKGLGQVAGQPRISTRSAPVQAGAQAGRFVQVGVFRVAANAQTAAARLAALGLPARIRPLSNGAAVVRAGPFVKTDEAQTALAAARNAGFGDAFLRR
jgi:cell division protein FtsN